MGQKFSHWNAKSENLPNNMSELKSILLDNRDFKSHDALDYGDHGLDQVIKVVVDAIKTNKRIALYADYDVDGTMSCVSWIWFFKHINFSNYLHYIPDRFKEGYGLNLKAVQSLVKNDKADLIITMDTGITANKEAEWCKEQGVEFICTDHHMIQPDKMPDCIILNPKLHPDPDYQELCGCGITFVLLRKLAEHLDVQPSIWADLLALCGMATICDVVPLNGVNHKLAKMGVDALIRSDRPILKRLREACLALDNMDEKDVGFRLGPRINAVGRLEHADHVINAFIGEDPEPLVEFMGSCNERRKIIQKQIVEEARQQAFDYPDEPILFLGGDWHAGVVGIAASKLAEEFWRPVWLFQKKDGLCKGSARSILGFDVTKAMLEAGNLFEKAGGHKAAGGYAFKEENEDKIREFLTAYAQKQRAENPALWESRIEYDCSIPLNLTTLQLVDQLDSLKPFGHCFEEPRFCIEVKVDSLRFYNDKQTGEPRHTAVTILDANDQPCKVMFFNEVHKDLESAQSAEFIVSASRNHFRGKTSLSLMGHDYRINENNSIN